MQASVVALTRGDAFAAKPARHFEDRYVPRAKGVAMTWPIKPRGASSCHPCPLL